jgi:tetratricopeptide (TPR) repeat protein
LINFLAVCLRLFIYKLLLQIKPNNIGLLCNVAICLSELGWHEESLWYYSMAIAIEPHPFTFYNRGITYTLTKQLDRAVEQFSEAIDLDDTMVEAYYNRASIYLEKKYYDLAIEDFSKVIESREVDKTSLFNRALCYTGIGEYSLAISDLNKFLEFRPTEKDAYTLRGTNYFAINKEELALDDYYNAQDLDPITFEIEDRENILMYYYARLEGIKYSRRILESIEELTKEICKHSDQADLYFKRAMLNTMLNTRAEEAVRDLTVVTRLKPNSARAYYERGKLLALVGDFERCREDLKTACGLDSYYLPYSSLWMVSE